MKVLVVTKEWPSIERPNAVPFLVNQIEYLRKSGIEIEVFNSISGKNPFYLLKSWIKFRILILTTKFDIIHIQWGTSVLPVWPTNIPIIVHYRGSDLEFNDAKSISSRINLWVSNFANRISSYNLYVSEHMLNILKPLGPYDIIPSGLDLEVIPTSDKVELRRKHNLPLDKKIVFFPSNIDRVVKRYALFEDAISKLSETERKSIYVLLSNNCTHKTMLEYMKASDVMVFTSSHEGSPNVIKEAIACNLPIVSVNVGDVESYLRDLEGSYIVSDDPSDIANFIWKAINERPETYSSLHLTERFDIKYTTQKLIETYKKVLNDN